MSEMPGYRLLNSGPFRFGFITTLGVLLALVLGLAIGSLTYALTLIFFALFVSLGLYPLVLKLESLKFSRTGAVLTVMGIFIVVVGLLLWLVLRAPRLRQGIGVGHGIGLVLTIGVGLAVVLAFLPKKADRYILPAIPFLAVVAAAGLAAVAERWRAVSVTSILALIVTVEATLLTLAWPYPLAAYNPLLGGAPAAERWISVGWGEGLDQIAPVLDAQPDRASLTVSTPYPEVLQAQIAGRAVDLDAYDVADYAVRYIAASQRHLSSPALDAALAVRTPLTQVEIAGVPYAELYELDRPAFAGGLLVRQLDVSPEASVRRGWVTVRLALSPSHAGGVLTAPGLPPSVTPLEVEALLLNAARTDDVEASVTRAVLPDSTVTELRLRAPNGLGRYVVGVRVTDPQTGGRLPVAVWPVGAPQHPNHLTFPSLSVRVQ